jgi:hypothetical protein
MEAAGIEPAQDSSRCLHRASGVPFDDVRPTPGQTRQGAVSQPPRTPGVLEAPGGFARSRLPDDTAFGGAST